MILDHSHVAYPWTNSKSLWATNLIESGINEADSSVKSSMTRSTSVRRREPNEHKCHIFYQSSYHEPYDSPALLNSILGTGISLTSPTNLGRMTSTASLYNPLPSLFKLFQPTCPASTLSSPKVSMASTSSPEVLSCERALKKDSTSFLSLSASDFQVGLFLIKD